MFTIETNFRACVCCGGSNLISAWKSNSYVTRSNGLWSFPINISVCQNCGFCFSSPAPNQGSLLEYYSNGFSGFKGIGLPYSINSRLAVLKKYARPEGVFAEVGGDEPGEFHEACANLFKTHIAIDISADIDSTYRSLSELNAGTVDVLAHYDVLEHVLGVEDFLAQCFMVLKPGGVMICEVPDLRLYPRNLLMLECEHVNHFSVSTLNKIAMKIGFNLIEVSHKCSRSFGFLSVFRKDCGAKNQLESNSVDEHLDAMACLEGGKAQIEFLQENIKKIAHKVNFLVGQNKKVTLWGVNELLRRLIMETTQIEDLVVVDSDPRRKSFLSDNGVVVFEPKNVVNHIVNSELVVICAPRYKAEIINWMVDNGKKILAPDSIKVLGEGLSGESLL